MPETISCQRRLTPRQRREQRRERRMLAQMLHAELSGNPPWTPGHAQLPSVEDIADPPNPEGAAWLDQIRQERRRQVRQVMRRAPADARANPQELLVAPGPRPRTVPSGAVRLHGEDYSLVFGYTIDPQPRPVPPVLLLIDGMYQVLRVDTEPDIPTRVLVVEQSADQLLEIARSARPDAFTEPVTADVDDHRQMSRPR